MKSEAPKGRRPPKNKSEVIFSRLSRLHKRFRSARPGCFPALFGTHPDRDNGCIAGTRADVPCERHELRSLCTKAETVLSLFDEILHSSAVAVEADDIPDREVHVGPVIVYR